MLFLAYLVLAMGSAIAGSLADDAIGLYVLAVCFGLFAIAGAILDTKKGN